MLVQVNRVQRMKLLVIILIEQKSHLGQLKFKRRRQFRYEAKRYDVSSQNQIDSTPVDV